MIRSIDLSKAIKLKDIMFRLRTLDIGWIIIALETITSKHRDFHEISLHLPCNLGNLTVEELNNRMKWPDLDRLLVELSESHAIRTTFVCRKLRTAVGTRGVKDWASFLLPEMMKRAAVDLFEEFVGPDGPYEVRLL